MAVDLYRRIVVFTCSVAIFIPGSVYSLMNETDDDVKKPSYNLPDQNVTEGEDLVIPWTYDYPSDWKRQSTYWRYWNSTIEKSKKVTLMYKSGLGQAKTNQDYITNGSLVEDKDTVAGMVYYNVHLYDSGYYELTMDFLNQPSFVDTVYVTVTQKTGLGPGPIAGICIGAILGVIVLVVVIVLIIRHRARN